MTAGADCEPADDVFCDAAARDDAEDVPEADTPEPPPEAETLEFTDVPDWLDDEEADAATRPDSGTEAVRAVVTV